MPSITAPLVLGVAGLGLSAYGMIEQGKAASSSAAYQAQVARNNATTAQQNADYAIAAGVATSQNESRKGAAALAHTKVAQAANNVDVNSGSAVKVRAGEAETGELNTETTMNNALLKAYGYKTEATGYSATAGLEQNAADTIPIGAGIGAGATLLTGASSLLGKWSPGSDVTTSANMSAAASSKFNPGFEF